MDALLKAKELGQILKEYNFKISVAESCTGGLLASSITDIAGSSDYFTLGVVTYSTEEKIRLLGVEKDIIDSYGAVSENVVYEMVMGVANLANTDIALATTGYAGPAGGTEQDPVGTVYMGIYYRGKTVIYKQTFTGTRTDIKTKTVYYILDKLLELLKN